VDGLLASTIFGRHGGIKATSRSEASLPSCWCSAPSLHQVVRPRWSHGVQRRRIYAEYGCSGVCAPFLGGNALRMSASGGGGSQGPDCILTHSSRVFYVFWQALLSNFRFFCASVVKGHVCISVTRHVLE
jgi:hypothetical protein